MSMNRASRGLATALVVLFALGRFANVSWGTGPSDRQESLPPEATDAWWNAVQQDLVQSEYQISEEVGESVEAVGAINGHGATNAYSATNHQPAPTAFRAPNRAQGFQAMFTANGIRVVPRTSHRDESPAWEWGMSLTSWGRDGAFLTPSAPVLEVNGNRIEYQRDDIVEWYVNDARGLEQGFTIARRLEGDSGFVHLNLTTSGNVVAAISEDGQRVDFLARGEALVVQFDHLQVQDARGVILPARFEQFEDTAGEQVSIVFEDRNADYPITIDPLATSPSWTAESDQADAGMALVATAGDVNGDGYSDVIVGAHLYDNGETDEGRVFVYMGSPAGLATISAWTAESNQAGAQFGIRVATAGDVNGDGYSDVSVGAWLYDRGQENEGSAFVWYGGASGLGEPGTPANADWSAESDQADAGLGIAVATLGDVNGDEYGDVAVGSWTYGNGESGEGRVFVWYGSGTGLGSNGTPANADWFAESDQVGARLGYAVSPAGDVNADGYGDLLAGAIYFDGGEADEGGAFVWHGGPTGLGASGTPANADWSAQSNQTNALLGNAVSTAGDVNGDGYSDVIIGATGYDQGEADEGWCLVWYGSASGLGAAGTPANADWIAQSNQAGAGIGGVACAGDVNGDGYADVVAGSGRYDNGQNDEGRVFLWYGGSNGLGPAGLPNNADWSVESDQADAQLGFVATAGDVNGDGRSDVIVGASLYDNGQNNEGRVYVYHGSARELGFGWMAGDDQASSGFGYVASAGDVNGDGYSDVIVGAPAYDNGEENEGRAFVYHGSITGPSPTPNWTAEGNQSNAFFAWSVATAGDVNGDGFSDVIVGAYSFDDDQSHEGRAFVYHGSATGLATNPSWTADGNQTDGSFGYCVATAGDVNGDGYSDVIISDIDYGNGEPREGRASVYHGSATGLASTPDWTAESNRSNFWFGATVASAGDVNGDGYSDVIVGADDFDQGDGLEGAAFVWLGSSDGLGANGTPANTDWMAEGDLPFVRLGSEVAGAGDVNGDGFSDVIVSMHEEGEDGAVLAWHGGPEGLGPNGTQSNADWRVDPDDDTPISGIASAGDINGDGFSDVIVGSRGEIGEGRVFVYHGSTAGLSTTPDWTEEGGGAGHHYGASVASAGDVNGDGLADIIVGIAHTNGEGRAYVYNGGDVLSARRTLPRQMCINSVTPIAPLGRSDHRTRFRIFGYLPSPYGRTRMQLECEVKPLGTLLDGTNTFLDSVEDTGGDGDLAFNHLVTGLADNTQYHWRVRAGFDLSSTPYQSHGPWIHMPNNGWNEADLRTDRAPVEVAEDGTLDLPGQLELWTVGSNPGHGRCELVFALGERGPVDARVLDVQGRTVAVLIEHETFEPGSHVLEWDGRDRSGSPAVAGVYFVGVLANGESKIYKTVLLR